ncbi:MAG: RNA polymerase subunit sigma-24 [Brevundimonas sp.]|uniref:RNA polymerase sigma factor n=1 Tax=Brevundimonas sp. TaxID=1871086 RepID=UPI000DB8D29E|nr:sigma-70 family RNA polymerase sigma factor [Brevundimonas sp.]PZU01008.1 MAG: RNA polymerase subunit sigma-24 [Brevundimonas sp.]
MPSTAEHPRLEEVVSAFRGPLLRFFQRRVRGSQEAEDLTQEVFGRLIRQDLGGIGNMNGYVFQVAANVLRDEARRASVRSGMLAGSTDVDVEDERGFSPERVLQNKEALQAMVSALYELSVPVRTVFSQYHLDGVAQVEIARRMGMSLSTVEKHMAKANAHLLYRLRGLL